MKITVLNTGGTFNKRYNPISGELEVPKDGIALEKIVKNCHNIEFDIKNIISKDSLEMTLEDRKFLYEAIKDSFENIIIVHGTDTLDITAKFLDEKNIAKKIILTGAMVPMSIDETEAVMNFSQAIGFLNSEIKNGVYVSMHGAVASYDMLLKNRQLGRFLIKER